jgi:hypothetical protein
MIRLNVQGQIFMYYGVQLYLTMSNRVGDIEEGEGTYYLSRAHGLIPGFLEVEGSMLLVALA